MAYRNTLYPYAATVKRGEASDEVTGHAGNVDEARRHLTASIATEQVEEGQDAPVVTAFSFNGEKLEFQAAK